MILRLVLATALICLLPSSGFPQSQGPIVTKMGNGLTVILQEDHATDLVGVDVWVKAGSGSETPEKNGISHLIEHLVFQSTGKRQPGDVDREIESLGATLDAHTSRDWAHFNTTVSSRYLNKALDVLADVVSNAQFREIDLQRERPVILEEIAKKQTNPIMVCHDYLAAELYGSHPYALPVEGTPESVKNITRQDILDRYRKFYVPGNMAAVLVGDFDAQQAITAIGNAFDRLAAAPVPEQPKVALDPPPAQVNKSIYAPFKFDYLAIGFLGPPGSDYRDVCATDVLLTYFGFGYRTWMYEQLRDKMGLAVDVSADFLTQRAPGAISLIAATTKDNTDKAKGAVFARIAQIRNEGIPEASMALAKRSLLGQYAFQNETFGGRANSRGFYFAVSEPEFASKYTSMVQSVTNEDIVRVARKYLDPDHAVVLTVGPDQGGGK